MKRVLFLLLPVLLLAGCSTDSGGGGSDSISGTVSVTANVKIGFFSNDYWFLDDFLSNEEDKVAEEFDAGPTGSYTPLKYVLPDNDGSYSISFPDDVTQTGDLIAWIDTNGDGVFDLGTEDGYFSVKDFDGTLSVVSFGYYDIGGVTGILVSYQDGQNVSQNDDISLVGYTGYNFTLD